MQTQLLHSQNATPPRNFLPVLQKLKTAYLVWFDDYAKLPKTHRYTIGQRVDDLLVECVEAVGAAAFAGGLEKIPHICLAVRKLDTVKLLLMILWETKSLGDKRHAALSEKLDEIGKNLGAWHGGIIAKQKQNSPSTSNGEK